MFGPFSHLQYRPCPECGASIASAEFDVHTCEQERWLDYQMFQLRSELAALEDEIIEYLDSAHGRFELWYAQRERRRRAA